MRAAFADSGYWIALLNPRDELHETAVQVSSGFGTTIIVTSEMVLTEVLNHFAESGQFLRSTACAFVERLCDSPDCQVVPQTSGLFRNALRHYKQRPDKNWSLTDCASILMMESEGVKEVLTHDRHFQQAGFIPLLR